MKKQSLIALITSTVAIGLVVWTLFEVFSHSYYTYAVEKITRQKSIDRFFEANQGIDENQDQQILELSNRLKGLSDSFRNYFFAVRVSDQLVSFQFPKGKEADSNFNFQESSKFLALGEKGKDPFAFYRSFTKGRLKVTAGFYLIKSEYIKESASGELAKDGITQILLLAFFVFAVAGFHLYRLVQLIRVARTSGVSSEGISISDLKSSEEKSLFSILTTHEDESKKDQEKIDQITRQLPHSIMAELGSGIQPPYEFEGALVRMDINNLSSYRIKLNNEQQIALDHLVDQVMSKCRFICQKYGGLPHEVIWDEFICYFKDTPQNPAAIQAVQFIREFWFELPKMSQDCLRSLGIPLTMKAAVDFGTFFVRASESESAIKINSDVFITTVRILPLIDKKSLNALFVTATVASEVSRFCTGISKGMHQLRGVKDEIELFELDQWSQISNVVEDPLRWADLKFYRHVSDFQLLINYIISKLDELDEENFQNLVKVFYEFKYKEQAHEVIEAFRLLLQEVMAKSGGEGDTRLPTLVTVAGKIFNESAIEKLSPDLIKLISFGGRVGANVLELLPKAVEMIDADVSMFGNKINNRKLGNISFQRAKIEFSKGVLKDLSKMIESEDPKFRASGIWALTEIFDYYQNKNPVLINSHEEVQELLHNALHLRTDLDETVQKQVSRLNQMMSKKTNLSEEFKKLA